MRTLKNSQEIHNTDYGSLPFGGIKDETETTEGTPVIELVYGDILSNLYKFVSDRGISFSQLQDNENNGYQLVEALKRNVNILNDIERIISKTGNEISLDLDFSLMPNKCFLFCKSNVDLDNNTTFQIKDSKGVSKSCKTFSKITSSSVVYLVLDNSQFRIYDLFSSVSSSEDNSFYTYGSASPFNSQSDSGFSLNEEIVVNNQDLSCVNIQNLCRQQSSDQSLELLYVSCWDDFFAVFFSPSATSLKCFRVEKNLTQVTLLSASESIFSKQLTDFQGACFFSDNSKVFATIKEKNGSSFVFYEYLKSGNSLNFVSERNLKFDSVGTNIVFINSKNSFFWIKEYNEEYWIVSTKIGASDYEKVKQIDSFHRIVNFNDNLYILDYQTLKKIL